MHKWISCSRRSIVLFTTSLFFTSALSAAPLSAPLPDVSAKPVTIPSAPMLAAKGYLLMDADSGRILAEKNMHKRLSPASLTKLMTLYIASQAIQNGQIQLNDKVTVSKEAWSRGGSRLFLKQGAHVTVQNLINGIIVASGNDACVALAEFIAGNETNFAKLMNQNAAQLGMKDSHYVDSTGLPRPNHYSTPYDLALLARAIIKEFPEDYGWYKQKWIKYNGIRQPNRNRLLWRDDSADGLKTGHTKAAGYCLIASAKRHGMRLISVVMGAPTDEARAQSSQALLNWGFRFYKTYTLFNANTPISTPRVYFGENKITPMGTNNAVFVTIPSGSYDKLKANMQLAKTLTAPIEQGQRYGSLVIKLNGEIIKQTPIIALQDDPKGGLWTQMSDHVAKFFHGWFN